MVRKRAGVNETGTTASSGISRKTATRTANVERDRAGALRSSRASEQGGPREAEQRRHQERRRSRTSVTLTAAPSPQSGLWNMRR